MFISAVTKSTLVDYPGKIACIVFTVGCNFRCPFCHNPECVLPEKIQEIKGDLIPEEVFFNFLKSRIGMLDGVSICGGEPTLYSDLYDFAKKIKELGFLVKLDTNGSNVDVVERLIEENILDYVAVDMKYPMEEYSSVVGVQIENNFVKSYEKLLQILLNGKIDYEYRTTVIKGYHDDEKIEKMTKYLSGIKKYYLQNYKSGNTLKSDFDGGSFTYDELLKLKNIAGLYIKNCEIRN